jgi:hypothetical protein
MAEASISANNVVLRAFFSQLLVQATDLCQSKIEAEAIMEELIMTMDPAPDDDDDNDDDADGGRGKLARPRDVWNAIADYFELDEDERKSVFRKCQEYCHRLDQKKKLPAVGFAVFFLMESAGEVLQQDDDNEYSDRVDYSEDKEEESNDGAEGGDEDSDDESAYYFMNDNGDDASPHCELCERSNIKLTKHHLIPKSTWPRMTTRLLHAVEAMEKGGGRDHVHNKEAKNMILGTNLDHVVATVLSFSSTRTISSSHKCKQQHQEKDAAGGKLPSHPQGCRRAHIRQALSYTCNICRQCHSTVHATHDNMTLALEYNTTEKLLQDPVIYKFCHWASKQRAGKYHCRY